MPGCKQEVFRVMQFSSKRLQITAVMALAALFSVVGCKPEEPASGGTTSTTSTTENSSGTSAPAARKMPTAEGNSATGDTLKLGLVASLNGDQKPWGEDSERGARLAVEEFNAAGGANGKNVELLVGDSNSQPEAGKSAAEKLIADGSLGLIGEVASGITIQMAKTAFDKGVPVVAIGATKNEVTDEGAHVFRVCYTDAFQGPVMAEFAYKECGKRKMAIMTDKKLPYSTGLTETFKAHFLKLGGEIVAEEFYEQGQSQFSAQLTNLKAKNPDGIFLSGYFPEVGPICKQAKEQGLNTQFFGGDGWDSLEIINTGGEAIIGGFFCNHYNNRDNKPEVKNFLDKWKAKYGKEPGTTMGALSYDATKLMCEALKRATAPNSKALIEAIEATENFKGVSGDVTLKGMGGNPPKRALVVEVKPLPEGFVFRKAYEASDITK
ncbi:MAG: hypothetical protein HONBIEJF_00567 [Fimbriimonadaceae bacterium]|nr:hypothetical protein [Fimbriimonadaceae bacterium]